MLPARLALLVVAALPLAAALQPRLVPQPLTRRGAVLAAAALAGGGQAARAATVANGSDMLVFKVRKLYTKAQALRQAVRTSGAGVERVSRERASVLLPLQEAMAAAAPGFALLSAEQRERAELQPRLLSGHYLELDKALADGQLDAVQRELEEVEETVATFLELATLARGRLAGE